MLFPAATSNCQWFFYPGPYDGSYGELDLAKQWTPEGKINPKNEKYSLQTLYMRSDDYYIGHQSVPILGSSKPRVISNHSLPIACWLATKM